MTRGEAHAAGSSIGAMETEPPQGANRTDLEASRAPLRAADGSSRSADAQQALAAEALNAEIYQLRELLRDRTTAWRDALRQLSKVQNDVAALTRSSSAPQHIESMSEFDWARIEKP